MTTARKGKIARLPLAVRDEVNRRLLDGEPASKVLPWLNAQEPVLRVLDDHFNEEPVTPQNLSEWRAGGYADWLAKRERVQEIGELSKYAAQLGAAAGGNVNDGSAAIIGGKILNSLEHALSGDLTATDEEGDPVVDVAGLVDCVVKLRASDIDVRRASQRDRLLDQRERAVKLAEDSFQMKTAEAFLKFYADKRAQEIADSPREPRLKITQLRELMFGSEDATDAGAAQS